MPETYHKKYIEYKHIDENCMRRPPECKCKKRGKQKLTRVSSKDEPY